MKAVILCAGKGTRLYPVTLTMPKPLVPVANKALLRYAIETLTNMGATEIGLVVDSLDSPIRERLGDGMDTVGVPLTYIAQTNPKGLAHAVKLCQPFIGDEPFIVYLGDNVFQDRMDVLYQRFQETGAELKHGKIVRLVEKPKDPPTNLAVAGVYVFQPDIFDAIDHIKPSWRDELEITDAIQYLLDHGKGVIPYVVDGWWIDAGKPDSIMLANQLILEQLPFTPVDVQDTRIKGD